MYTENIIKKEKFELILNVVIGLVLLVTGILMRALDMNLIKNNRDIIGLSLIPLAIAFSKYINIISIRKYPAELNSMIVSENDERLVQERNEAEAKSNRLFRWLINLVFLGYTLMIPSDVFEAVGWWIVLALFCIAYLLPCIFLRGKTNKTIV